MRNQKFKRRFAVLYIIFAVLIAIATFAIAGNILDNASEKDRQVKEHIETLEYFNEQYMDYVVENEFKDIEEPVVEEEETVYTVQPGDSYYKICQKFYNNGDYCYALANYNKLNARDVLHTGCELKIPDIDDEEFVSYCKSVKQLNVAVEKKTSTQTLESKPKVEEEIKPTVSNNLVKNNPGKVDTSGYTYLGVYTVTGYTPGCAHCCGNANGITASGVPAVCGRTIAAKGIEFGKTLYIEGYGYYVVEDRGGFQSNVIDMAAPSHEACYAITNRTGVKVYIVPDSNNINI